MIDIVSGNLLSAPVEALVNTVNTEGVMGKGIALQFKRAFPAMYADYEASAHVGRVKIGSMHVHDLGALVGGPRWIINFPTKRHWRAKSRLVDIQSGLQDLIATVRRLGVRSIALPPLGCGNGGLLWDDVRPLIERAFEQIPHVDVRLYAPEGAPLAKEMITRTAAPRMTMGAAALIGLMDRYTSALLDPLVSLLEIHKLMYFFQASGQPLRLNYEKGKFGPYATNLGHLLNRLEGHWISGYGDGADTPSKPLEVINDGKPEAISFFLEDLVATARMDSVTALIEGYENPYGLELLSSVHWVAQRDAEARASADRATCLVHEWNSRKRSLLKADHLRKAWSRLGDRGWLVPLAR